MTQRAWWWVWIVYAVGWTFALLSPFSIEARDAFVPEEFAFGLGKLLHIVAYAGFVVVSSRLDARLWLLAVVFVHAPVVEYLQRFTYRTSQLMDVVLDWIGVGIGFALTWWSWNEPPEAPTSEA
jgi:hypothetical protein